MTLLKDLIDIPERVHKGDFVLRLSEGVEDPKATLRNYVVTEQLASCLDRALGLIQASVCSGSSKAAYLHGSFGSGKSPFGNVTAAVRPLAARSPDAAKPSVLPSSTAVQSLAREP